MTTIERTALIRILGLLAFVATALLVLPDPKTAAAVGVMAAIFTRIASGLAAAYRPVAAVASIPRNPALGRCIPPRPAGQP